MSRTSLLPPWRASTVALAAAIATGLLALALAPSPLEAGVAAREAAGRSPRIQDFVVTGLWWATAANTVLLVGLFATRRVWQREAVPPEVESLGPRGRPSAVLVLVVAAAMLTAGTLALPRLGQSFWDDEASSMRRSIHGGWRMRDGALEFREASWLDTFWYYRMPNNHVVFSIASRLSLATWRVTTGAEPTAMSETAMRAPVFVVGLLALPATAFWLWRIGFPMAGLFAAAWLALHPWFLRYVSEGRGYGFTLTLTPLLAIGLVRVLHRGSWARWLQFALLELLLLWAYPGAVAFVVCVNLAAVVSLFVMHGGVEATWRQLARWFVANTLAAMVFLQLMAPNLPQLLRYLEEKGGGALVRRWFENEAAFFLTGMPWMRAAPLEFQPFHPQLSHAPPLLWIPLALATLALLVAGTVRLLRAPAPIPVFALFVVLAAPGLVLFSGLREVFLWEWYVIFALPLVAGLLGLGLEALAGTGSRRRRAAWTAGVALLGLGAVVSTPARDALRERSLQPRRESVERTRPTPAPGSDPDVVTVSFGVPPDFYDPRVLVRGDLEGLLELERDTRATGQTLYVNLGWPKVTRRRHSELYARVTDPERYELVGAFHGFEPRLSRFVYRRRADSP